VTPLPATILRRITAHLRTAGVPGESLRPALELAVPSGPGDSGAPVLVGARVAGVVFARSSGRRGVAYAVDGSVLRTLLR
jgi:hypothetical protein